MPHSTAGFKSSCGIFKSSVPRLMVHKDSALNVPLNKMRDERA